MGNVNAADVAQVDQKSENERLDDEKEGMSVVDFKMVTFSLAGKDYAIDIMKVKEIAKAGRFTYVPNTLPFVLGVYNLRGDIIPIIDLRKFFNIDVPPREDGALENMLIVTVGEQVFGVVVDAIDKVLGIQKSTIQPPHPLFGDINIKYIYGVVEATDHLYILLDIERIFNFKLASKEEPALPQEAFVPPKVEEQFVAEAPVQSQAVSEQVVEAAPVAKTEVKVEPAVSDQDYGFVVEELNNYSKFVVSDLNEGWVKSRFKKWTQERNGKNLQLQSQADSDEFLKGFWSRNNGTFWDKAFAEEVYKLLPDNKAAQIVVWNPGCGKGYESYSLACVLKRRYPDAKIRIYAHEIDLLSVSNAPLLSVPAKYAQDWFAPFVTKSVSGDYSFTQDIKDIIMFEYHDINNSNSLPMVDIIFARDVLSLLPAKTQASIVSDFDEKIKGNGIVIIGENESLGAGSNWGEKTVGSLTFYNKQ